MIIERVASKTAASRNLDYIRLPLGFGTAEIFYIPNQAEDLFQDPQEHQSKLQYYFHSGLSPPFLWRIRKIALPP